MAERLHHVGDFVSALVLDPAFFPRLQVSGEGLAAFLHHAGYILGEVFNIGACLACRAGRRR